MLRLAILVQITEISTRLTVFAILWVSLTNPDDVVAGNSMMMLPRLTTLTGLRGRAA